MYIKRKTNANTYASYVVVRSDDALHYGRKGMKWGKNIFGDVKQAGSKVYGAAKTYGKQAYDTAKTYGKQAYDTAKTYGSTYGKQAYDTAKTYGKQAYNTGRSKAIDLSLRVMDGADYVSGHASEKLSTMKRNVELGANLVKSYISDREGTVKGVDSSSLLHIPGRYEKLFGDHDLYVNGESMKDRVFKQGIGKKTIPEIAVTEAMREYDRIFNRKLDSADTVRKRFDREDFKEHYDKHPYLGINDVNNAQRDLYKMIKETYTPEQYKKLQDFDLSANYLQLQKDYENKYKKKYGQEYNPWTDD